MIVKKIPREKLYKREYEKDFDNNIKSSQDNEYLINLLVPVIALAIKEGDSCDA